MSAMVLRISDLLVLKKITATDDYVMQIKFIIVYEHINLSLPYVIKYI